MRHNFLNILYCGYFSRFPQAPVDKVLFLQSRLSKGLNESAVLVSSEGGYLHFWAICGRKYHKGIRISSACMLHDCIFTPALQFSVP